MYTLSNRTVILLSGGIDSTVLLYRLIAEGHDITPLYINYGQIPRNGELSAIRTVLPSVLLDRLIIIDVPGISSLGAGSLVGEYPTNLGSQERWFKSEFFPNRNMILISLAAAYCSKKGIQNIAVGFVGENSYSDTSVAFTDAMSAALRTSIGDVAIIAPYAEQPREVVITDAAKYNVPIEMTFSCNSLGDRHCQYCVSCFEREQAINQLRELRERI